MNKTIPLAILAALLLAACGQPRGPAANAPAAPAEPAASSPAGNEAASTAAADGPVVCCEFNGARGSSTRTLCASYRGREVPTDQCPGM